MHKTSGNGGKNYRLLKNSLELGKIVFFYISVDSKLFSEDFLYLNRDPGVISKRDPGGELGIQRVLLEAMRVGGKLNF